LNNDAATDAARWQQVKSILDQALEVPAEKREQFVTEVCGTDPALRREVTEFLTFSERADDLLPENGAENVISWDAGSADDLPERAGPYRIIREIGRGGMGVVCLAKRDDGEYERLVALKLIGRAMNPAKVAKLFWRERQILAQLDHPNIARLLDGGTTEGGQLYYAMEFVDGEPLDKYCKRHKLNRRERLELFLSICSAVSYAHRCLIIHRDLKPGNVLVTEAGVPKLLDFGVARMLATDSQPEVRTETPLTPYYASPEQIRGESLTVATDIYSLGVLLYQLLSGHYPYGKREGTAAALQAILLEAPIPLRQQATGIPADLENIVMTALRKEPERRYATVDALWEDIRAFLDGFPVKAAPDTFSYRFGKFTKRNRWAVTAASVALLGMTASGIVIWREKQQAEMRFQQVRRLAHSVVFELNDAIDDLPGSSRARELLTARGLGYLDALAKSRGGDPALTLELAQAYMKIGAAQGDLQQANVGDQEGAAASYSKARALLVYLRQKDPSNRDVERSLALVDNDLAVLSPRVRVPDVDSIQKEAVSLFQDIARTSSGSGGLKDLALAHFYLAFARTSAQQFQKALPLWKQALAEYTKIQQMENNSAAAQRNVALTEKRIASVYYALGDYADFTAHDRKAIGIDEGRLETEPQSPTARMDLSFDLVQLGWCLHELRDDKQAIADLDRAVALRRGVASADPHDFRAHSELEAVLRIAGVVRSQAGFQKEALSFEQEAAAVGDALHRRDPNNMDETTNYALDFFELGDIYRGMAIDSEKADRGNWRAALTNFQRAQTLAANVRPSEIDDPNNREKLQRLPDRIANCVLNLRE
jgi:non-specific serine/threonine protein kinase/serine/threonine-protein kinase